MRSIVQKRAGDEDHSSGARKRRKLMSAAPAAQRAERPRTSPAPAEREPRLLPVAAVAAQLGVKESTVRSWILTHRIEYVKLLGGAVRISSAVVEKIVADGAVRER
jgi:excisionase family DNA binding protein